MDAAHQADDEARSIRALITHLRLPHDYEEVVGSAVRPIAARIARRQAELARAICVGLCGSQGSGKSTMAEFLRLLLEKRGLRAVVLSLDDLYLPREARELLARDVHPLLRTRGVPGTHDVPLGLDVLGALCGEGEGRVAMPRFDKAADTRLNRETWPETSTPVDVVIFEGWCVGARPQPAAALVEPVNSLERDQDPDGSWRRFVNDRLGQEYRRLFDRLDMLVMLHAPDFEAVCIWRALQEAKLAETLRLSRDTSGRRRAMSPSRLATFMMHFQRLTEAILEDVPARADALVRLTRYQIPKSVSFAGDDHFKSARL